jgi:hypothetical protein
MAMLTRPDLPVPRRSLSDAAHYEQGRCSSSVLHAARKTLQGQLAVCDGSKVTQQVSGRFDATAKDACPACVKALSLPR